MKENHNVWKITTAWDYISPTKTNTVIVLLNTDDRDYSEKGTAYDIEGYSYNYNGGYLEWKSLKPDPKDKIKVMKYLIKFVNKHHG